MTINIHLDIASGIALIALLFSIVLFFWSMGFIMETGAVVYYFMAMLFGAGSVLESYCLYVYMELSSPHHKGPIERMK